VNFNVGNADMLFTNNNSSNTAFSELAGPNAPINGCGSFDWGLSFLYGRSVFTGIEQQPRYRYQLRRAVLGVLEAPPADERAYLHREP